MHSEWKYFLTIVKDVSPKSTLLKEIVAVEKLDRYDTGSLEFNFHLENWHSKLTNEQLLSVSFSKSRQDPE